MNPDPSSIGNELWNMRPPLPYAIRDVGPRGQVSKLRGWMMAGAAVAAGRRRSVDVLATDAAEFVDGDDCSDPVGEWAPQRAGDDPRLEQR